MSDESRPPHVMLSFLLSLAWFAELAIVAGACLSPATGRHESFCLTSDEGDAWRRVAPAPRRPVRAALLVPGGRTSTRLSQHRAVAHVFHFPICQSTTCNLSRSCLSTSEGVANDGSGPTVANGSGGGGGGGGGGNKGKRSGAAAAAAETKTAAAAVLTIRAKDDGTGGGGSGDSGDGGDVAAVMRAEDGYHYCDDERKTPP